MPGKRKIQGLAGAAGFLCAAEDELAAAGYELWSLELREMIDIIAEELGWLEDSATKMPLVGPHN
jgi:hypothetical protein